MVGWLSQLDRGTTVLKPTVARGSITSAQKVVEHADGKAKKVGSVDSNFVLPDSFLGFATDVEKCKNKEKVDC